MRCKYPSAPLKEVLDEHLRNRTLERELAHRPDKDTLCRRIADIRAERQSQVNFGTLDNICTAFGHPEWVAIVT